MMNLVIQGACIPVAVIDALQQLSQARHVDHPAPRVCRLHAAQMHPAVATLCAEHALDFAWVPTDRHLASFGLYVTDMDSTLITIECIDEIADMHGLKAQVAEITEAAMQGELDFRESLHRRVALLEGLPEAALAEVYDQRVRLTPGADVLLRHLKEHGLKTMLVSGGFTFFTERLQAEWGFDYAFANQLEIRDGRLTGRVIGEVVDAMAKRSLLERIRDQLGLRPDQVLATGDGANDLPMLQAAGVGVAYCAKPVVRGQATHAINHNGLDAVIHLFN